MAENNNLQMPIEAATDNDTLPTQRHIESFIYNIRDQQVMLDKDLAVLYGVETRVLNQAVKRNMERFPEHFMFRLTKEECSRSQFVTLNGKRGENIKYLPYAFTDNGIAMLSAVLKSKTAVSVSIRIMEAFTAMRHFLATNAGIFQRLNTIEYNQLALQQHQDEADKRIDEVLQRLEEKDSVPMQGIFYDGQIFDAHTFVCDLIRQAKQRIVLIDNYVDDTVLKRLDKRSPNAEATIYTKQISAALQIDIDRHNAQYAPVEVRVATNAHDRFMIIDDKLFHIGASIKDLGKKVFAFSLMAEAPDELLLRISR